MCHWPTLITHQQGPKLKSKSQKAICHTFQNSHVDNKKLCWESLQKFWCHLWSCFCPLLSGMSRCIKVHLVNQKSILQWPQRLFKMGSFYYFFLSSFVEIHIPAFLIFRCLNQNNIPFFTTVVDSIFKKKSYFLSENSLVFCNRSPSNLWSFSSGFTEAFFKILQKNYSCWICFSHQST